MRYSIAAKFLAVLITACALVAAIGGAAGIVAMEDANLYINGIEVLQDQEYDAIARAISSGLANRYAVDRYSNLSYAAKEAAYPKPTNRGDTPHWRVSLSQENTLLVSAGNTEDFPVIKQFTLVPVYPFISLYGPNDVLPEETTEAKNPSAFETVVPEGYLYYQTETEWEGVSLTTYYRYFYEAPEYTVTVYMRPEVLESSSLHLLTALYPYRYAFIAILALGLLVFAVGLVYLVWSAGRATDRSIKPGGLNLLPIDLYALAAAGSIWGLYAVLQSLLVWVNYEGPHIGNLSILAVNILCITVIALGFFCCLSAQVKCQNLLWQQSLTRRFCKAFGRLWQQLPIIWQWLLRSFLLLSGVTLSVIFAAFGSWLPLILIVPIALAILCYNAFAYGSILAGARHMAKGDLSHKISTRFLTGSYRECAEHLNALADVAMIAAEKQLRSERMRTELITNVTHDIKTPLTSIINYVDLLGRPHSPEDTQQYLEVLGRQSQRLKKLIDDLLELNKASSGTMPVHILQMDASQTVLQALGEFSDKLEKASLESVFVQPEEDISILADGRLAWRVLSNLLSNAVKYAMPGTRLYLDLSREEDRVLISLKNISRQPLNLSAEELTERFVRGDASRNTEGSGLGLNIAKSLMELQGGDLQLTVDGDLFKVTLSFPAGEV